MLTTGQRERLSLRWVLVIVALAVVAFLAAIAVQRNVFPFYSGDHDEPVYRFQAAMLRDGAITLPLAQNEFFRPWLSGPADGHLVMAFTPGWPAVLMVADVLTGSMLVALGATAALTVATAFVFARELLGSVGRAALATAIIVLSPFTLMLSGTYLNYVFALALFMLFGALLLRGLRDDSPPLLCTSGLVLGAAFLTRPYDAVLFALPFAVFIIATRRHDLRVMAKIAGWVALGLAPGVIVMLVYNSVTTGSAFTFPTTAQSDGFSRFGWGVRSIAPDTPELGFSFGEAVSSMGTNLWALPTWLFGTYLTLGLAVFGSVRLWREQRATLWLLLGLTFIFPVAYLAWWASSLTTTGALNGLGPHYYLPMVVPIAVLAAHGAIEAARHRTVLLVGGLVAAVALTAIALPPKFDDKRFVADASRTYVHEVNHGLRQRKGAPALVIQERHKTSYIMEPYPFIGNPPDLDATVLYARDRGARNIDLLERSPKRRAFRLLRQIEPGRDIRRIPVVVKAQSVRRAPALGFRTTIVNTTGDPTVTAYARFSKDGQRRVLDTHSTKGERYDVTWTMATDGLRYDGPPAPRVQLTRASLEGRGSASSKGVLVIGATFGRSPATRDPAAVERRYYARVKGEGGGTVEVLTADEEWTRFGSPINAWLPIAVRRQLQVEIAPRSGG